MLIRRNTTDYRTWSGESNGKKSERFRKASIARMITSW
jgi:hypothetical protein